MNGRILRVLLIEDDDDHAELIKRSLTDNAMPHELVHARDGQEGLDVLLQHDLHPETHAVLPDLILLDLRLPKVDGFEVLRRIKHLESLKHIPVIILTSSEAEQDISRAYDNYAKLSGETVEFRQLFPDDEKYRILLAGLE